jgi:Ca2+ transporting ATPase
VSEDVSSYDEIGEHKNDGRGKSMLSLAECQQMLPLHAGNVYLNVPDKVTCAADLVACLDTDTEHGISKSSGWSPEERMEMYGSNALEPPTSPSFLELVLDALNEFTVLVLLGAGGASMLLELWLAGKEQRDANLIESVSILAAVAVVVLVSAVNNWQKDKQFKALQEVQSKENVRAIRNGREMSLPAEHVVVGDLLVVETGDILCADGVLIQGYDVKVDESHLTGESDEVEKNACVAQAMYSGSKVLTGVGRMIVTSVGSQSQSGMIADMVVGNEEKSLAVLGGNSVAGKEETLLQKKLANYASFIGKLGLGASVLTTAIMAAKFSYEQFVVQGVPWSYDYLERYLDFFITGVTILVRI